MILSNYHTHTTHCDGQNDAEEMVLQAIGMGFRELGFSGHSYTFFDERYCMSRAGTAAYKEQIRSLKAAYGDRLRIRLGVEQDFYSEAPTDDYEFIIGSVHYVKKDGLYLEVDWTRERQLEIVEDHYGGDFYSYIEDYFATVAQVYEKTRCHIVGHFDLVKKFNKDGDLFDPRHPRYVAAEQKALKALLAAPVALEINTGGIAKGCLEDAYPGEAVIRQWLQAGKQVCFCSDCHDATKLLAGRALFERYVAPENRDFLLP